MEQLPLRLRWGPQGACLEGIVQRRQMLHIAWIPSGTQCHSNVVRRRPTDSTARTSALPEMTGGHSNRSHEMQPALLVLRVLQEAAALSRDHVETGGCIDQSPRQMADRTPLR